MFIKQNKNNRFRADDFKGFQRFVWMKSLKFEKQDADSGPIDLSVYICMSEEFPTESLCIWSYTIEVPLK